MNRDRINNLLAKYWAAETSLKEEEELRHYFETGNPETMPESAIFQYFATQRNQSFSREVQLTPKKKPVRLGILLSIAASVVVLAFAYFSINPNVLPNNGQKITINDPEQAWQVTMDALSMVNTNMEKGETVIRENMIYFDKTFVFKR